MSATSGATLAKGVAAHLTKPLSVNFVPGDDDVLCGRGSRCFNHLGNQKFRKLVEDNLHRYTAADSKAAKAELVCEIVKIVRAGSPEGGFVKKDTVTGLFYEVGDFLAREKTSQTFRDSLQYKYKSSNASKRMRRQHFRRGLSAPNLGESSMKENVKANDCSARQQNSTFSTFLSMKSSVNVADQRNTNQPDFMLSHRTDSNRSIISVLDFDFEPIKLERNLKNKIHDEQCQLEQPMIEARKSRPNYTSALSCPNLGSTRSLSSMRSHRFSCKQIHNATFTSMPNPTNQVKTSSHMACGKRNLLLERIMGRHKSQEQLQPIISHYPIEEEHQVDSFEDMPFVPVQGMSEFDSLMQCCDDFDRDQYVQTNEACLLESEPRQEFPFCHY